jgi:RNA polymerase sigma-70 factor (sigma-E family)
VITSGEPGERREAFDDFYRTSAPRLLGLARLLTGDRGRAEDLVQETLWSVHRSWADIRDPGAAPAYARTIMVRLATRWRARRWNGEVPYDLERIDELGGGHPDEEVDAHDERERVARALGALPPKQRAVLVLRYFEGLNEEEIATLLRCSPGTVKSRSSRAREAMRASGLVDATPDPVGAAGGLADVRVSLAPTRPSEPIRGGREDA